MRRAALAAFGAGCAVALAALVLAAASDDRGLAFTLNVRPQRVVAVAPPGAEACQRDVLVPARFDIVQVLLGTYGRPGPPLALIVREAGDGRVLAEGRLPAGAADNQAARIRVGPPVPEGARVDVCVRNAGSRRVALYGGPDEDGVGTAYAAGRRLGADLRMSFRRSEPRSALALLPDVIDRAAVFRPRAVGAWTFWVLLVLVVAGLPLALGTALRRACGSTGDNWRRSALVCVVEGGTPDGTGFRHPPGGG